MLTQHMDAKAKNTRSSGWLAKRWESWGSERYESAQLLNVTEKYRVHLAESQRDNNLIFMGHRGSEGSRTPEDWPGQQYAAAPWDDDNGYGRTPTPTTHTGRQEQRAPPRGSPPAPAQPSPVYPQGDFDSWNDAPEGGGHWQQDQAGGDWGEPGRTGEWSSRQTGEWALADASPRAWNESTGQWD